jgi:hypothetical protein
MPDTTGYVEFPLRNMRIKSRQRVRFLLDYPDFELDGMCDGSLFMQNSEGFEPPSEIFKSSSFIEVEVERDLAINRMYGYRFRDLDVRYAKS